MALSPSVKMPQHVGTLTDEATRDDEFDRVRFVDAIADLIAGSATPLVIALYGSWGSGKSSLMLQLRDRLAPADGAPRALTVWFDPWKHSVDDNPAVALLHAVRHDLQLEKDKRVHDALMAIARAATEGLRVPYLGLTLGRLRQLGKELSEQEFERRSEQVRLNSRFEAIIHAARERQPRLPLVFFIDDLDRCKPTVAVAVLEALKLHLSLVGCVFVLAVDREPLEAAIAVEYRDLAIAKESYLDKIVQLPFTIPALDPGAVRSYLGNHLPERLQGCLAMLAAAAPDNPRQLKRTINSLLLHDRLAATARFPQVQPYNQQVMCAVVLIQNIAPDLYRRLRQRPEDAEHILPGSAMTTPTPPEWLDTALNATDARLGLSTALGLLRHPHRVIDIVPYLTLSESVATDRITVAEHAEATAAVSERLVESEAPPSPAAAPPRATPVRGADEVVERLRRSVAADPGDASARAELARQLGVLGYHAEALAEVERASQLYREMLSTQPDIGRPGLLAALMDRSVLLDEVGRQDEAAFAAMEAVALARELADAHPTTHLPDLASSLRNLSARLDRQGHYQEAAAAAHESVLLYRGLASTQPDPYLPDVVSSLRNLSARLEKLGHHEEMLEAANEAVYLARELAAARPEAYAGELAASLRNLSARRHRVGDYENAAATAREAVGLYRQLAEQRPDTHMPDLAAALRNLGARLEDVGAREEATAIATEMVDVHRRLAAVRPQLHRRELAASLRTLSGRLQATDDERAAATLREAVHLYRELASTDPNTYGRPLASSLRRLGTLLHALDRHDEAQTATAEAGAIREQMRRLPRPPDEPLDEAEA